MNELNYIISKQHSHGSEGVLTEKRSILKDDGLLWIADKSQDCNKTTIAQHDNAGASSHVKSQRGAAREDGYWTDWVGYNCLMGLEPQAKFARRPERKVLIFIQH